MIVQHLRAQSSDPKRVVILGSGGFVGKKLTERLERRGIEVYGLRSSDIDLCESESVVQLKKILSPSDAVIFASAITPDKGKDTKALMKNLKMGEHVASVLEAQTVSHVIYISSDAVFRENLPPIHEGMFPSPPTLYGLMHLTREIMIGEALIKSKIPYFIVRPCAIYGFGDTHQSYGPNRFIQTGLKEKKIKLFGEGKEKRPHLFIENFIDLLVESLVFQSIGMIHAIPGESYSFREVADFVLRSLENESVLEKLPQGGSITHKHFDPSNLYRFFPQITWTPLLRGIQETVQLLKS